MSGPMWHQSHISGLFSSLTSPIRASWVAYRSGMPFSWFRERSKNWAQDRWMGRNRKNWFRMWGATYYMRSKQLTVKMYSIEWLLVSDFHGNSLLVEMSLTGCTGCDAIVESVCAIIAELTGLEIGPYVELNGFLWTEPCSLQKGFQFSIPLIVNTYTRFDRLKCIFTAGLVLFFGETDFTPNFFHPLSLDPWHGEGIQMQYLRFVLSVKFDFWNVFISPRYRLWLKKETLLEQSAWHLEKLKKQFLYHRVWLLLSLQCTVNAVNRITTWKWHFRVKHDLPSCMPKCSTDVYLVVYVVCARYTARYKSNISFCRRDIYLAFFAFSPALLFR